MEFKSEKNLNEEEQLTNSIRNMKTKNTTE